MVRRRAGGFTLLELLVAMSIMCIFLGIILTITLELFRWEKKLPVNFMKHPQIIAVISRMRRDVLDAFGPNPYRTEYQGYRNSSTTLIVEMLAEPGGTRTVVWDFSTPGVAVRHEFNVGNETQWAARGLPASFTIDAVQIDGRYGVRLQAKDEKGSDAIDQIFLPRTTGAPALPEPE